MLTTNEVVRAWQVNNTVTLQLLDLCPDGALDLKPGKGKTVRSNFTHIVSVRKAYIEEKLPKEAASIPKLDWKTASQAEIKEALQVSSALISQVLGKLEAKPGKWTAPLFLAYLVAHEANHRAQIEIALRLGGFEPADESLYQLWDWSAVDKH
jgi:uncharacterized damage-inducible protein DinB